MTVTDPGSDTLATRAEVLFCAVRGGDQAKMGDLVALLTPILWHTVRAQNVDATSAEDVLQTTWLSLMRSADKISDPRAVLQWLIVSARREAWRVSRADRRAEPREIEPDTVIAPAEHAPDAAAERSSRDALLWGHLAHLPERCQQLLRVIAFADRPDYAAVAGALGMPVGSIGPTRGRCLAKLRAQLADDPHWED
jgi:RNA polymerase sigma factor (sigma-70 family)